MLLFFSFFSFAFTPLWIYFLGTPLVERSIPIPYTRYMKNLSYMSCRKTKFSIFKNSLIIYPINFLICRLVISLVSFTFPLIIGVLFKVLYSILLSANFFSNYAHANLFIHVMSLTSIIMSILW
jgi:hypothetical protein